MQGTIPPSLEMSDRTLRSSINEAKIKGPIPPSLEMMELWIKMVFMESLAQKGLTTNNIVISQAIMKTKVEE